jgi:hypothetical protein
MCGCLDPVGALSSARDPPPRPPDAQTLVDEADWPAVVTFFEGDGAGTPVAPRWIHATIAF